MRVLCRFAFLFAAGVAAVLLLPMPAVGVLVLCALSGILCCLVLRRWKRRFGCLALCLGLLCGIAYTAADDALRAAPSEQMLGHSIERTLTVCAMPKQNAYGCSMEARFREEGRTWRVRLQLDEEGLRLRPGDRVTGVFLLQEDTDARLDGRLTTHASWLSERPSSVPLRDLPALLAWKLRELPLFPADAAPLFRALLLGDRSALSYSQKVSMRVSGVYHVVAVSGMHVTLLLGFLGLLLGRQRRRYALAGIPTVVLFTLMTGCAPGTVRAVVMVSLTLLAPLFGREADGATSLAFGLLLLLLQNPRTILDSGLQLSFLSVAGLELFGAGLQRRLLRRIPASLRRGGIGRLAHTAASSLASTCAASALTLPFGLQCFGVASLIAPLTNLLLLWTIPVCFAGGLTAQLTGALCLPVGKALGWVFAWPARLFLLGTRLAGRLPHAAVYALSPYVRMLFAFGYLAFGAVLLLRRRWRAACRLRVAIPVAAAATAVSLLLGGMATAQAQFTFSALDVGQGQCLVLTSGRESVMVDCGGSNPDAAGETAARYLLSHGVTALDTLILTHFDADHCLGVPQLLEQIPVRRAFVTTTEADETGTRVLDALRAAGTEVLPLSEDSAFAAGSAAVRLFAPRGAETENEAGIAVLLTCRSFDILIPGDLPGKLERRLLATAALPDIEVLVAGHHGAASSTAQELLDSIRPEIAVISVGKNRYGHPAAQVLSRLRESGAEVFRTDLHGTVTIRR